MKYTESEVLQYIAENDVKFIKLFFLDIFGTIKSISIQPCELERAFKTGISFDASAVKGFLGVDKSDLFLVPDAATLSVLPWRPQHGRVVRFFCNIKYPDGTYFEGDSRYILQNVCGRIERLGCRIEVGTECEFYLFQTDEKGDPTAVPHDNGGYCDLAPLDKGENIRRDICITLEQMGIRPELSHHEAGPGQHEIDFKYDTPLRSADNFTTFKTVVKTVAARNGLYANFSPKPIADKPGSGLHINLSLYKGGHNLFAEPEIPEEAGGFLAGIMSRIREMTAFLNPAEESYARFGAFEAPLRIGWSRGNRSQLIRLPAAADKERSRIELRSPDPLCNPYTALALILSAGLDGLESRAALPPESAVDVFHAPHEKVENLELLPRSLSEALGLARKSEFIRKVLPEVTVDAFAEK